MAGTMVHLTVAEKLWKWLAREKITFPFQKDLSPQEEYFIAGNICPDGIMARKGYQREMKLHTHFRDGIPDGSFDAPGMVPLFEKAYESLLAGAFFPGEGMSRIIPGVCDPYDDG